MRVTPVATPRCPIAGVGLILSCLMFAGAMRAMRGDRWGLSAWTFAAAASIPYQLVNLALIALTARDLSKAIAELPPMAQLLVGQGQLWVSIAFCGVAILYYGICVIYLRTPGCAGAASATAQDVRRHRPSERQRRAPRSSAGASDAEHRRQWRAGRRRRRRRVWLKNA